MHKDMLFALDLNRNLLTTIPLPESLAIKAQERLAPGNHMPPEELDLTEQDPLEEQDHLEERHLHLRLLLLHLRLIPSTSSNGILEPSLPETWTYLMAAAIAMRLGMTAWLTFS